MFIAHFFYGQFNHRHHRSTPIMSSQYASHNTVNTVFPPPGANNNIGLSRANAWEPIGCLGKQNNHRIVGLLALPFNQFTPTFMFVAHHHGQC